MKYNIIIKDSHRALWYEDGLMTRLPGPARYRVPSKWKYLFRRQPGFEAVLVDVRVGKTELGALASIGVQ